MRCAVKRFLPHGYPRLELTARVFKPTDLGGQRCRSLCQSSDRRLGLRRALPARLDRLARFEQLSLREHESLISGPLIYL